MSLFKNVTDWAVRNAPAIMAGIGITGVITTAVLAGQATIKAEKVIDKADLSEKWSESKYEGVKYLVGSTWKFYLPALGSGIVAIACIASANRVNVRRIAALASAYSVSERALDAYKRNVRQHVGDKVHEKIKDSVAQEVVDNSKSKDGQVIFTGGGDTLCYDAFSGRYFRSSIEKIRRAENVLNQRLVNGAWISVNEMYSELGLEGIKLGEDLGWVPDNLIEFELGSSIANDSEPCVVVDYRVDPRMDPYRSAGC